MKMHTSLTHNGRAIDIGGDDGSNVALVHGPFYGGPDNFREIARLFVAAPDLLEALKEILPWHDSHPLEQTDNRIVNLCRAAIAKAEGRS